MEAAYRQLVRHAMIFGIGQILSRLASIILLPVYTRYLTPADYGIIAVLDLTTGLLSTVVGAGIATAAIRSHFQGTDEAHYDRVWWTAIVMTGAVSAVGLLPVIAGRYGVAHVLLGPNAPRGPDLVSLAVTTLWLSTLDFVLSSYLRSLKASTLVVGISLGRLLLNVVLNVVFLVWWRMGVAGLLWGNLLTAVVGLSVDVGVFVVGRGRPTFDFELGRYYLRFGWPLIVTGVLSAFMHEGDRYLLRLFVELRDVGLYAVAYQIAQGVNTLVLVPFTSIWSVLVYEIAQKPNSRQIYVTVFQYFVLGLGLVMLLAALFAGPILNVIAPAEYASAADLVPIVCLAYVLFSMHEHFKIPALLANRTVALLPAVLVGALTNLVLNLLLIPPFGTHGAAWASVLTFAAYSFVGLARYRRIERFPYPFAACSMAISAMAATYVGIRNIQMVLPSLWLSFAISAVAWSGWSIALFGPLALRFFRAYHRPAGA